MEPTSNLPRLPSLQSPPAATSTGGVNITTLLLLLVVFLLAWRSDFSDWWTRQNYTAKPIVARGNLAEDEKSNIELFQRCSPSVVYIRTAGSSAANRRGGGSTDGDDTRGTGSGFVWDELGHVVTNYHVIRQATRADVTLGDQSRWPAKLVGYADHKDIAVLKIEAPRERLRPIAVGNSMQLLVGQKVFAIGNPFGLDQTLSTGVISGLNREIFSPTGRPIEGVIQTDAAINPGNSGGPLLDSAGLLIGVNTAIASPSGGSAGVGFSVPSEIVNEVVTQIIKTGKVAKVGLGIAIVGDQEWRQALRMEGIKGVCVADVTAGGPAESAGIVPTKINGRGEIRFGDIITALDKNPVVDETTLFRLLSRYKEGDKVSLSLLRGVGFVRVPSEFEGEQNLEIKVPADAEKTVEVTLRVIN